MQKTNPKQIVELAKHFAKKYNHNPFAFAKECKIEIRYNYIPKEATIIRLPNYTPLMFIHKNHEKNINAQNLLCAHELGHFCLHSTMYNTFGISSSNTTQLEYEANLFAVAFLCSDDEFCMPIEKMNNSMLSDIINKNL